MTKAYFIKNREKIDDLIKIERDQMKYIEVISYSKREKRAKTAKKRAIFD